MLTTVQAAIYCGITRPTFAKYKIPYSEGRRKGYKLYDPRVLDEYFPDAPKIMPPVPTKTPTTLTVVESVPKFEEHSAQELFDNVVEIMGDRYSNVFDATIETLLRVQHSKRFYHAEVEKDPLSDYSKLLDQSIKQELSLIKALQL